ncbi:MAG: DUF547 domain-containing protein [Geminicoccaceae bacterium]
MHLRDERAVRGQMWQWTAVVLLLWLLTAASSVPAVSAEVAEQRWLSSDEASMKRVDHSAWETILLAYLRPGADGIHRVAYGRVSAADRSVLDGYLDQLSKVEIGHYKRSEQMAYWINLYNALTVDLILDNYPIPSLIKLQDQASDRDQGPWNRRLISIDGVPLSLNDIEKRILKPIWQDQRVHYALSCGAISCPNLQPVPYDGDQLEQQLSYVAMAYVNDPRCIEIDGEMLRVSSLYRWNIDDFGGSDQAIIHHLMAYAEPELAMALQNFEHIHGDGFDWRLNDISE